jgi:hypothetical protein
MGKYYPSKSSQPGSKNLTYADGVGRVVCACADKSWEEQRRCACEGSRQWTMFCDCQMGKIRRTEHENWVQGRAAVVGGLVVETVPDSPKPLKAPAVERAKKELAAVFSTTPAREAELIHEAATAIHTAIETEEQKVQKAEVAVEAAVINA